jgi:hypothetical protein
MRFDFVFSYWIFTWYLLYIFKVVRFNPKIFLEIGLLENLAQLSMMIYYNNSIQYILLFIIINTLIKVLPIYSIWNSKTTSYDIYAGIILFFVYFLYLRINRVDIRKHLEYGFESIKENKSFSPAITLLDKYVF